MTTKYDDLANLVDHIRNARYGEMVRYTEDLIKSDWRDFTTPAGFHFQFRECEFDYFLLTMSVDPTILRHAYLYADIDDLTVKQMHLADITGKGKTPAKNARRSVADVVAALAGETSGAARRIEVGGEFVTDRTGKLARDPGRRRAAERGKRVSLDPKQKRWDVRWSDDKPAAEAIVEKLLADEVLARDVYKKLHSHNVANAAKNRRRSMG